MTPEEFERSLEGVDIIPEIERRMKLCCEKIHSEIIQSMDNTPRSSKPYFSKRSNKWTYPSLPGHPPAPDTEELKGSINFEVFKQGESSIVGRIGSTQSDKPYGAWHELGLARGGKPRPWLAPAVEKNLDFLKENLGEAVNVAMHHNFRGK